MPLSARVALVNQFIPSTHKRGKLSPAELAHHRQATTTRHSRHAAAMLPGQLVGVREFFTQLAEQLDPLRDLPTLILWADADPSFTDKHRQRLEATFPNHTTTVLDGVGHLPQSDAPADFSDAIGTWWAGLTGNNAGARPSTVAR